jgi:RHS repeat-associated protein
LNGGCGDPSPNHFTGLERDAESGLDHTLNRQYGSNYGRWLSPDPIAGHVEDPQTLNRYVYARNNPETLTDPAGLDFYLSCQKSSDTCQKDATGNLVQGEYVTDANNNRTFRATVITSASLQDPTSGNTATVNEKGVQITTTDAEGNKSTAEGIFVNKTPAADIQGSGKLSDFAFHIDSSNEATGTLSAGTFSFNANRDDTRRTLDERGAFRGLFDKRWVLGVWSADEIFFHHSSTQHRFGTGPSPHFSVPDDPKNTVPTKGPFHVDKGVGGGHAGCAILHSGCTD